MSDGASVPMEDLLAHRQWVRALAQRLAADESTADDLEQATWLAAIEHPPRDARSLRGWLGTVLRNLHRNKARDASRRGRREETVARREISETAQDLVAEAETQTLLVREVLALDEPYRSTVLLRWFEDLTPEEVARRQGVPLETVRTRLKRAVARLRERMDERHGGDRGAWCLLLLGGDWRGMGAGTGAGTTAATIAAGGVAMGLATKLTIAASVLVALGATAWWMRGDDVASKPAAPTETANASSVAAPPAKHDRRATQPGDTAATTATLDLSKVDRDLDLHGVVVRTDGSPVADAKVQAVEYPWRRTMTMDVAALFEERLGPSTTSDAAGAFALRLRRGESTMLRVSADGLATQESGTFMAGERVKITLAAAVTLHVAIKDERGAPVAGAALWLLTIGERRELWTNVRATTDASGRCDFVGLSGGLTAVLTPLAGAGDFTKYVTLPADGETTVEIVSPTGRTIRGRVFDSVTLAPIQDARVGKGRAYLCATTTDGGGRFEIRNFTGKFERDLYVKAPGYAPCGVRVETQDTLEVGLRRGADVVGRVVGPDGEPVVGAFVSAQCVRYENGSGLQQYCCAMDVTDAEGKFRAADFERGAPLALIAHAAGFGRVRRSVAPAPADLATIDLGDVGLPAPRAIEGRVLSADGAALPGIVVRLAGPGVRAPPRMEDPGAMEERRTDDIGRFRFGDLGPGEYAIEAHVAAGSPLASQVALTAERDILDVVLQPKAVSGPGIVVVVKDDSGEPLPDVDVSGRDSAQKSVGAKTDAQGRATLRPPGEGPIATILVAGYMAPYVRVPEIRVEAGRHEYAVTLERAVHTTVRLLDPDGAPLRRGYLEVEPKGRATVYSTPQADGAWTDAEGRMCLSLAVKGEFSVVFRGRVYDEKRRGIDSLLAARADHVTATGDEIVLNCRRVEDGRSVTVRVLCADGTPDPRAVVRIEAAIARQGTTDTDGRARFDDLAAREFQVNVSYGPRGLAPPAEAFVPAEQELVLRRPAGVSITGTVVLPGGAPAAGASVMVLRDRTIIYAAAADASGRFAVQVPAGDEEPYKLSVSAQFDKTEVAGERSITPQDRDIRVELTKP